MVGAGAGEGEGAGALAGGTDVGTEAGSFDFLLRFFFLDVLDANKEVAVVGLDRSCLEVMVKPVKDRDLRVRSRREAT